MNRLIEHIRNTTKESARTLRGNRSVTASRKGNTNEMRSSCMRLHMGLSREMKRAGPSISKWPMTRGQVTGSFHEELTQSRPGIGWGAIQRHNAAAESIATTSGG